MGRLYDMLPDEDKNLIEGYIKNHAGKAYIPQLSRNLDYILRHWDNNKRELFDNVFGEQFILRRPYEYKLPVSNICDQIYSKMSKYYSLFRIYQKAVHDNFMGTTQMYELENLWNYRTFYDRKSHINGIIQSNGTKKSFHYSEDTKPLKIVKEVLARFVPERREEWEDMIKAFEVDISRCFNQAIQQGELCLSIHPLDYMTMSDNDSSWHSCMSWQRDGEYSQGTIEMMNSPSVIVAYLHHPNSTMAIPRGEWNDKKWRELFVVTPEIIQEVKAYPYDDEALTSSVIDWLQGLMGKAYNYNYVINPIEGEGDEFRIDEGENEDSYFSYSLDCGYMYNDFDRCDNERKFIMAYNAPAIKELPTYKVYNRHRFYIPYSGPSECMCCGDDIGDGIEGEPQECRVCANCSGYTRCSCCGAYYDPDEMVSVYYGGDHVDWCRNCVDERAIWDEIHEEYVAEYDNDLITVYLKDDEWHANITTLLPNKDDGCWFEYFTALPDCENGKWDYYIEADKCLEYGARLFGYSLEELQVS